MNTFQNQYKFEPIGERRANAFLFIYVSVFRVCPHFKASMVFIQFIAVFVFRVAHRATALHSDKAVESSLS